MLNRIPQLEEKGKIEGARNLLKLNRNEKLSGKRNVEKSLQEERSLR